MHVLIAPDKFKHALDAHSVCEAIAAGVREARPDATVRCCPLADGGEGTGRILAAHPSARERTTSVLDPLARPRDAHWWYRAEDRSAVVESAEACGLDLLAPAERDPTRTSSFGVGQLVRAAADAGALRITLCVGGSATVDGGSGCLQALGWRLLDAGACPISQPVTGGDLLLVARIAPPDERLFAELRVLHDVTNPLLGPSGAAAQFAPQKGANPQQVELLERGLRHWADLLAEHSGREIAALPGTGAAGGIVAALAAAQGAALVLGFDEVARHVGLHEKLASADLAITGEGSIDAQTTAGKVVCGVCALAAAAGVPVIALAGNVHPRRGRSAADLADELGVERLVAISPPGLSREQALAETGTRLRAAAAGALASRVC